MKRFKKNINQWAVEHFLNLVTFNIYLVIAFLLRSAGYFHPYFDITVNLIVVSALVLSIFMLGARSKVMFLVTLIFWIFAGLIRIFKIEVWAERTTIYAYEAMVLGILILVWERITKN